ncbi:MAG TPA: mechanosensitive ion channel domain-containing protein [Verrucomicrobiae bacterium]|nr:mechanosensitive ion channel domain-containing protein [Verrucomicrobiae bacterium]
MIRPVLRLSVLCLIFLILSLAGPGAVRAQQAAPAAAPPAPSASAALPAVDPAALGHLIETLQDPVTRDRFLSDLKALQAARQNTQPAAPAAPPLPYALGAALLQAMTDAFGRFRTGFEELATSVGDPARLWAWARLQVEDPGRRALLLEFLWQLALILAVGFVADLIARHYVRRGQRHLRPVVKPRSLGRIGLLLAHSALELLPILALAAAAYIVVAVIQPGAAVRLALLAIVSAVVVARTAFVVCRFLLSPFAPTLRLFPLGDETAAYLYIWAKRLISLAVYGYFVLQVAVLLGLPDSAYELALKILGLIWAFLLAALILQSRDSVAKMILHGARDREDLRNLTRLRQQLAHSWHVLALIYLLAVYVTWAADVPGGFTYLGRGTGLTVLILILAWLALVLLRGGFQRFLVINKDLLGRYPLLEQRANRYLPLLRRILAALIRIVAVLAILAAWHVDIGSILGGAAAREIIGRIATILLMLGAALAIWEIVDASISFYLERRDENGKPILTSSRARTLLPLVRNALLIVISLLAGLTILSELGVDIAPLLAGAGVVGLAIGFGAQTLVKDVITGAFILFEDTVNVGDVIMVNSISGTVEGMSIRTLKIRAGDGTLHSIPFGTVTTVSNQSRDFGYYTIDVAADYREDTDTVIAALRQVFDDLIGDPAYRRDIVGGLEIQGVDRFTDNAVHIVAGIRTRALRQAPVGREFNRRMKLKFDELGIRFSPPPRLAYAMAPTSLGPTGLAPTSLAAPAEALPGSPTSKPSS